MRQNLARVRSSWRRILITVLINCLLFFGRHTSRRTRIHWLGRHRRPRRAERSLGALLIFGAMLFLEAEELVLWSTLWGGGMAIFINLHTVYRLIPRKRAYWVK